MSSALLKYFPGTDVKSRAFIKRNQSDEKTLYNENKSCYTMRVLNE